MVRRIEHDPEKWEPVFRKDHAQTRFASKRKFMCLGLAGAAGAALLPRRILAQGSAKMSKAQAEYQDSPKGIQMCATCSLFDEPHACKVVEGDVSPNGWCKAFAMAD
jgi:High potential iron-sulfur protein